MSTADADWGSAAHFDKPAPPRHFYGATLTALFVKRRGSPPLPNGAHLETNKSVLTDKTGLTNKAVLKAEILQNLKNPGVFERLGVLAQCGGQLHDDEFDRVSEAIPDGEIRWVMALAELGSPQKVRAFLERTVERSNDDVLDLLRAQVSGEARGPSGSPQGYLWALIEQRLGGAQKSLRSQVQALLDAPEPLKPWSVEALLLRDEQSFLTQLRRHESRYEEACSGLLLPVVELLERYGEEGLRAKLMREVLAASAKRRHLELRTERMRPHYEANRSLRALVVARVKGGFKVDLGGVGCFLPMSQVCKNPRNIQVHEVLGRRPAVRIIKLNLRRMNIVVSVRAIDPELSLDDAEQLEALELPADLPPPAPQAQMRELTSVFGAWSGALELLDQLLRNTGLHHRVREELFSGWRRSQPELAASWCAQRDRAELPAAALRTRLLGYRVGPLNAKQREELREALRMDAPVEAQSAALRVMSERGVLRRQYLEEIRAHAYREGGLVQVLAQNALMAEVGEP